MNDTCHIVLLMIVVTASGCGGRRRQRYYAWGAYPQSMSAMYESRDILMASIDCEQVRADRVDVDAMRRLEVIPPGRMAHWGYLAYLCRDTATAREYFILEKQLYPESTVFMNALLRKLKRP